jgi:hypothetical protein
MKKIITSKITLICCLVLTTMNACKDLDEEIYSSYSDANFPSTPDQFAALTGPVYVASQKFMDNNYFDLQETGTDEIFVPSRGGDWYDGGKWKTMHYHEWTSSHELMRRTWDWGFGAIATCNRVLELLENAPETSNKQQTLAEIKTMRAWYYFLMMDSFGDVPIITTYDDNAAVPNQEPRAKVFEFIANELETNAPELSADVNVATYGKPTQWMAYTLLARMYLNAEVYTGTGQWDKVVENCDKVIASNKYALASTGAYFDMFMPDNGPQDAEPIFSIPFDAAKAKGQLLFKKMLHQSGREKFGLNSTPWNGWAAQPAFFDMFEDGDIRKNQWLYGQQYDSNGNPLSYNGVPSVLDPYYFPTYDVGGADNLGRLAGARNMKYYPDPNAQGNDANNDIIIFRYADVLLMKAEAILRGSTKGTMADAVDLVNQIRDRAYNNDPEKRFSTLTLMDIYHERGREFVIEMVRRQDMIRFGTFDDPMLFKGQTNLAIEKLFPIPATAIASNSNLVQNPGY